MDVTQEHLEKMRQATATANWKLFEEGLHPFLCLVSHDVLLDFLFNCVRQFISEYLRVNAVGDAIHPIGEFLTKRSYTETDVQQILDFFDQHKGEPGVNNFRCGLKYLLKLFHLKYCEADYKEAFQLAFNNMIISIPTVGWGAENPDLFNRWAYGTKTADLLIPVKYYARDPKVIEMELKLRTEFIRTIEKALDP